MKTGIEFDGNHLLYMGVCTRYRELSRMAPLYMETGFLLREAMFQRNAEMFNYYANFHPRLVNLWEALQTGIPEIQAKALSLLHDSPKNVNLEDDPFEGNVIFTPHPSEVSIPWTPTLYKEIRDYIFRTKVAVNPAYHPISEMDGSVVIHSPEPSSDEEDAEEDAAVEEKEWNPPEPEIPDLESHQDYIYNTGMVCGFFDVALNSMEERGSLLEGIIFRYTRGNDVTYQIPALDNLIDINNPQHLTACTSWGYLYPILSNLETLLKRDDGVRDVISHNAIRNARIPIILALPPSTHSFPSYVGESATREVLKRMKSIAIEYDGKIDSRIIEKYKNAPGIVLERSVRFYTPSFGSYKAVFFNDETNSAQEDAIKVLHAVRVEKNLNETLVTVHHRIPGEVTIMRARQLDDMDLRIRYRPIMRAFYYLLNKDLILAVDEKLGGFLLPEMKQYLLKRAARFEEKYAEILARLKSTS